MVFLVNGVLISSLHYLSNAQETKVKVKKRKKLALRTLPVSIPLSSITVLNASSRS